MPERSDTKRQLAAWRWVPIDRYYDNYLQPPGGAFARLPRHDRASEFDSWDCVDELVDAEDFSQEWGEAAAR